MVVMLEKKERRIAVIKDVLKRLRYLTVNNSGFYIGNAYSSGKINDLSLDDDSQEHVNLFEKECEVCAKGALLLSHIRLYDGFDVSYLKTYSGNWDLEEFDKRNIDLVEIAFEKKIVFHSRYNENQKSVKRAIEFGNKYKFPKQRLKAILNNMLENDGVFVP